MNKCDSICRSYRKDGLYGVTLSVYVQPRSSFPGPNGLRGEELKWGVQSAPTDGRANAELLKSLAKAFSLRKNRLILLKGATSRSKVVLLKECNLKAIMSKVAQWL